MTVSFFVLIAMTVAVAILAAYRWYVVQHEDDFLHLNNTTGEVVNFQRQTEHTVSRVDRLGIGLTIATAAYGLILMLVYLYRGLH